MVAFSGTYIGNNSIRWAFSGMTYDKSNYYFQVDLNTGYHEVWDGALYAPSTTTTHNPGEMVTGTGQIEYKPQGFYQSVGSDTVSIPFGGSPPPPPGPPGPPPPPPPDTASTNAYPNSGTSFDWWISGLSNPFNTSSYTSAAVFNAPFSNGQSFTPSGLVSRVYASSSFSTSTPTTTVNGATSGGNTYTLYGGAQASNGSWYTCGSVTFTSPNSRPADWQWYNSMYAGGDAIVYAFDWDDFHFRIDEFRNYKGLGYYSWSWNYSTYQGDIFSAQRFNECLNAINGMGASFFATYVSSGADLHAYDMLNMRDTLNSII